MRYVALLRGINVGGGKAVEMKKLKALFEGLGFTGVATYINSGNAVFDARGDAGELAGKIERALKKAFGFEVRTIVRDARQIRKLAKAIPAGWTNDAKQRTDVLFLWEAFDSRKSLALIRPTKGVDALKYVPGAIVWNMDRKGYARTGMRKFIGTPLYKHMTARNVNTVRKLADMMKEDA